MVLAQTEYCAVSPERGCRCVCTGRLTGHPDIRPTESGLERRLLAGAVQRLRAEER